MSCHLILSVETHCFRSIPFWTRAEAKASAKLFSAAYNRINAIQFVAVARSFSFIIVCVEAFIDVIQSFARFFSLADISKV